MYRAVPFPHDDEFACDIGSRSPTANEKCVLKVMFFLCSSQEKTRPPVTTSIASANANVPSRKEGAFTTPC
ncbi:hypothetical protein CANARDRAFT_30119, partial [[Candida] arabinofermentans NRRL YB-2248]